MLTAKRLPSPVICVGNITTGGTGKTPAVIALAKRLGAGQPGRGDRFEICPPNDEPYRIAILTRGYKRRSKDPVLPVSNGVEILATPQETGDEPYLMASSLKGIPVIVGADRYRSGRYAVEHFNTELFLLDDGYQHIRLHRDIDILLIDATNPFGNGCLLPKGILREPLEAISRADCVIINRVNEGNSGDIEEAVRSHNQKAPIFHAVLKPSDIKNPEGDSYSPGYIAGKGLLLFSGIGNPRSFRNTVEAMGGKVLGEVLFPDHHWYEENDMERIFREARSLSAEAVLTTEKDAIRLMGTGLLPGKTAETEVLILRIEMEIDRGFHEWIAGRLERLKPFQPFQQ